MNLQRTVFWLGVILTSLTWRVGCRLVTEGHNGGALVVSGAGVSCLAIACVGAKRRGGRPPLGHALGFSVAASAAVLLVTAASTGALLRVGAWLHDISVPGRFSLLVEGLSPRLGIVRGLAAFRDMDGVHLIRLTYEGLGLYEMWYIGVGAVAAWLVFDMGISRRDGLVCAGAALLYVIIRFICLAAAAVEFDMPRLLWHPVGMIVSYMPLALLLGVAVRGGHVRPAMSPKRAVALAGLLGAVAAVSMCSTGPADSLWRGPRGAATHGGPCGTRRPTVLIDESHSNWEWATQPFDTASFGIRAEYNYACFTEYIGHFHDVKVTSAPLTSASLADVDVLIIKTPTEPYTASEIDAVVDFVRSGGGLLLIGDHTNLFGMTTYLNAIAGRFDMRFRSDDTFDLASGGFSFHVPPRPWGHPVVKGLGRFGFLTSCTIEGGPGIEPVMIGRGLGSEDIDYGHPNFFGNIRFDLTDRFGVFLQAAARRFWRGRVMLFTDSTCFSNFCMFAPGVRGVVMRFLDYLDRGFAGDDVCSAGGDPCRTRGADVRTGCAAPPPHVVLVDTTHSRAIFFEYIRYADGRPRLHFEEFYMSLARMGFHPVPGGISDMDGPDVKGLVMVNPGGRFTRAELRRVFDFVKGGGRLLVLGTVADSEAAANQVLGIFGLALGVVPLPAGESAGREFLPGLEVRGGDVLAAAPSGRVTAARVCCGDGVVVAAVDSYAYSEAGLGQPLRPRYAYEASAPRFRALFGLLRHLR
jgi:hypothetical protein